MTNGCAIFAVLITVSMKTVILWDVTPCSLVEACRRFEGTASYIIKADYGGSKFRLKRRYTSTRLHGIIKEKQLSCQQEC